MPGPVSMLLNQLCNFSPHGFRGRISCAPDSGLAEVDDDNDDEERTKAVVTGSQSATSNTKSAATQLAASQQPADGIEEFDDD